MIRHAEADGFGFEEAAEVFLIFDGPVTVAGAEAPSGVGAAFLGLGFEISFQFVGELLGEGGRGGVEEEAAHVIILTKAGVAGLFDVVSHRDGESGDGERMFQMISDRVATQGERSGSLAQESRLRMIGKQLPDAARRGQRARFGGCFSDGFLGESFLSRDARIAQHFLFVDGKECAMVKRHEISFLSKNFTYYII